MRSEPAHLGRISLDFAEIHLGQMKILHMNTRKWASAARWERVFFNPKMAGAGVPRKKYIF